MRPDMAWNILVIAFYVIIAALLLRLALVILGWILKWAWVIYWATRKEEKASKDETM